jgi:L-asparagine transporter-like permease
MSGISSGWVTWLDPRRDSSFRCPACRFSNIITYASLFGLLCLVAMNLSRSEAIRALALWCLVLIGICAPVLVYIADDGAAAVMKNKAAEIQQKQQDRLSHAQ